MSGVHVCVIRHGQTAWNVDARFQGWTDVPLDEVGRAQAEALRGGMADRSFDTVWSSDLRRAVETAEVVAGEPIQDSRLREMNFGVLEGTTWKNLSPEMRAALQGFDDFVAPEGESARQLRARVFDFFDELEPGSHLVVTHGGVIRMLLRACGGEGFPDHGDIVDLDWTGRTVVARSTVAPAD